MYAIENTTSAISFPGDIGYFDKMEVAISVTNGAVIAAINCKKSLTWISLSLTLNDENKQFVHMQVTQYQ